MARIYTEDLYSLPMVDVLDWELWERLVALVTPYLPGSTSAPPLFFVTDNRGQYDTPNLETLRTEVEKQDESPETIRLTITNYDLGGDNQGTSLMFNAYGSSYLGSGGSVQSTDEHIVHHLAARTRDLFAAAAKRRGPDEPRPRTEVQTSQPDDRPLISVNRAKLRRILYDPWVIGIGTLVIGAAIIGIFVALMH